MQSHTASTHAWYSLTLESKLSHSVFWALEEDTRVHGRERDKKIRRFRAGDLCCNGDQQALPGQRPNESCVYLGKPGETSNRRITKPGRVPRVGGHSPVSSRGQGGEGAVF